MKAATQRNSQGSGMGSGMGSDVGAGVGAGMGSDVGAGVGAGVGSDMGLGKTDEASGNGSLKANRLTSPSLGATPGDAKAHNRVLTLCTLYASGPVSRADLARATGLTKVTISGIIAELISEGLVTELGQQESARPGKPAILVDLARKSHTVLCLDFSDHLHFHGALLDLDGEVLARHDVARDGATGDAAVALAVQLALALQARCTTPLLGIGVGTPGVVDDHGVIRTAPNLGWNQVSLQQTLFEHTGAPTVVANDANVSALAEYSFGNTSEDFILITIGQGVGSGLILGGRPVTGSNFASGEIGQVMVGTELGLDAAYSRDQVLERWLSVPAIEQALSRTSDSDQQNFEDHEHQQRVLREAGMRLGIVLAPVVGVLNLNEVVLAGPPHLVEGALADATLDMLRRRTMLDSHSDLVLHTSTQGADLVLRGALAIVLQHRLGISSQLTQLGSPLPNRPHPRPGTRRAAH